MSPSGPPSSPPRIQGVKIALTDEQKLAIGHVAAKWNMAQYMLEHLFWVLVPTDQETGKILTTHLSDEARCNVILTLSSKAPDAIKAKISDLIKTFDTIRLDRNRVIHNVWAGDVRDLAQGYKPSARGSYKVNATYWSAPDIEGVANEISDFTVDLMNFIQDELWHPSPQAKFFELMLSERVLQRQRSQPQTETRPAPHPPSTPTPDHDSHEVRVKGEADP
jgi:hypothetical protein